MGPLRLNLSTSGIGVSAGVRGARVSVGPRGTYVTLGRGGFQYRTKIASTPRQPGVAARPHAPEPSKQESSGYIQTATASELVASSPEDALHDLEARLQKQNLFAWYLIAAGTGWIWLAPELPSPLGWLLLLAAAAGAVAVYRWDDERRTARIIYDVDDEEIVARLALANAVGAHLQSASMLWHIFYAVATSDWKKNAGAGTLIQRTQTRSVPGALPHVELNLEPFCVPVGPQKLLFLPDRLIVWDGKTAAGLPYEKVSAHANELRFIEDESVPRDARQVDTTWRFVNRNGSPDRRFKDNRQLPVMEYGRLELTSENGVRIVLQTSTVAAARDAAAALTALSKRAEAGLRALHVPPTALTPAVQPTPAAPPAVPATPPRPELAVNVAVVLRYIAAADRRVAEEEIAFVKQALRRLLPEPDALQAQSAFGYVRSDSNTVRGALEQLSRADEPYRRMLLDIATELSMADGKATPKEVERLGEVRFGLGL